MDSAARGPHHPGMRPGPRTLDDLVAEAAARIDRLEPREALAAKESGALLVDIRSDTSRERDGIVPGSLHIPRTVLEWRLAGEDEWRTPYVPGPGSRVVLLCDHGYSTVLAAATLVDLGFTRAGDVVGGFQAWRAAGLPVAPAPSPRPDSRPGLGPPDA
jgi:rhodanese-related sulfurtransferase